MHLVGIAFTTFRLRQHRHLTVVQHVRSTPQTVPKDSSNGRIGTGQLSVINIDNICQHYSILVDNALLPTGCYASICTKNGRFKVAHLIKRLCIRCRMKKMRLKPVEKLSIGGINWQPLLGPLVLCPINESIHCNSLEHWVPYICWHAVFNGAGSSDLVTL